MKKARQIRMPIDINGYSLSDIMQLAWAIAKSAAKRFGGKSREYISEALKMAWARAKSAVFVPAWFVAKKTLSRPTVKYVRGFIKKETEKAVFVTLVDYDPMWVPKSVLA